MMNIIIKLKYKMYEHHVIIKSMYKMYECHFIIKLTYNDMYDCGNVRLPPTGQVTINLG